MEILEELRTYVHKTTRNYPEDREAVYRELTGFYERIGLQYMELTAPDQEEERVTLERVLEKIDGIRQETTIPREIEGETVTREIHTRLILLQARLAQLSCEHA